MSSYKDIFGDLLTKQQLSEAGYIPPPVPKEVTKKHLDDAHQMTKKWNGTGASHELNNARAVEHYKKLQSVATKAVKNAHAKGLLNNEEVEQINEFIPRFTRSREENEALAKRNREIMKQKEAQNRIARKAEGLRQQLRDTRAKMRDPDIMKNKSELAQNRIARKAEKLRQELRDTKAHPHYVAHMRDRMRNEEVEQINDLIYEETVKDGDDREYDYEGEMAKTQLKGILKHAQNLHDSLEDDTNLPEWVQSKITLAADYIQTAADYMDAQDDGDDDDLDEEIKQRRATVAKDKVGRLAWRAGTEDDVRKNHMRIYMKLKSSNPEKAEKFLKSVKEENAPAVKFPKYYDYKKAKAAVKEEVRYFSGTTVSGKPWKFTPPDEPKMLSPEFVKDRVPTLTDKEAHEVSVVAKDQYNDVDKKFAEMSEAKGTVPKTAKEKALAAKAEPKNVITHKDVLVARGVKLREEELRERIREKIGAPGKTLTKKPADPVVFHPMGKKKPT